MADTATRELKEPKVAALGLEFAFDMEERKFTTCPVRPDMIPDYETAQAWGYVVAAYSLVEQGFKALLHLREEDVPRTHELSAKLFGQLAEGDRADLRKYYDDYRALRADEEDDTLFGTLDAFLDNLDGAQNSRGDRIGSLDWRYLATEQSQGEQLPRVSINYLHEIIRGCIWILQRETGDGSMPPTFTLSQRERQDRMWELQRWLAVRINSGERTDLDDRWEVVWGPDARGRYDLLLFQGGQVSILFREKPEGTALPVVDKRSEYEAFNPKQSI